MQSKDQVILALIAVCIISGAGVWYIQSLEPTFEEELQYYIEWTKENPSSGGNSEWVFRDIRAEPLTVLKYGTLDSWDYVKTWYENLNNTETLEYLVIKVSYKELRDVVATWKAVYIDYDPQSKVIWSYALQFGPSFGLEEGNERWVVYYWEARA